MSNTTINCPTPIERKDRTFVFLAGPMHAAPQWQRTVPKKAEAIGLTDITFLSPRKHQRFLSKGAAVRWETQGLRMCDVILFWIPNKAKDPKPGREYALTTRMELAENFARGKKIILGIDSDIIGTSHMKFMAERYGVKVHSTLEECLQELKEWMERIRGEEEKTHFICNPYFGSQEALKRRPQFTDMLDMNQTLMEHWNQKVGIDDDVYVIGELSSDEEWLKFLNGRIHVAGDKDYKHMWLDMISKHNIDVTADHHDFYPVQLSQINRERF